MGLELAKSALVVTWHEVKPLDHRGRRYDDIAHDDSYSDVDTSRLEIRNTYQVLFCVCLHNRSLEPVVILVHPD